MLTGEPLGEATPSPSVTLRDYIGVIWLRKWLVVLVCAACTSTAFLASASKTEQYTATALLMYRSPTNVANPYSTSSSIDVNRLALELQSVVNTLQSAGVTDRAEQLLNTPRDSEGDYRASASIQAPDASSGASLSDSVAIAIESTDPTSAARVANAYAQAVIDVRAETQRDSLTEAVSAVRAKMASYQTSASRLTTDYLLLAQQLNALQVAQATVTGDFEVVRAASPPTSPSAPRPIQAAVVGFGVGLFAGIALAFVVGQLDTRVRTHREASDILGLPVVGRLPKMSKTARSSRAVATLADPQGAFAESVRMMRSNLSWAAEAGDWKSLLVTSARQGEGKSVTICNLAAALALAGNKVVLVDADLRAPRLHDYLGLDNAVGLTSITVRPAPVESVLQPHSLNGQRRWRVQTDDQESSTESSGGALHIMTAGGQREWRVQTDDQESSTDSDGGSLHVMTAGPPPPDPGELVASRRMAEVIAELVASDADYVLVDAPPLLVVGDAAALSTSVDGLLFVVDLDHSRRSYLEDSRESLEGMSCRKIGTVVLGGSEESSSYHAYG